MKAILIARVSTEEQKEAGNSLPVQVARLERYCQNKGFEVLQICSFDESAYKTNREEFDRIIDFVLNQQEKVIVCCDKVDRLTRNMFDKRVSLLYEKALKDELELHFVSDGQILNSSISAAKKFHFSISLGLAKYYSDAVSDNVRRAIKQKLRKNRDGVPYRTILELILSMSVSLILCYKIFDSKIFRVKIDFYNSRCFKKLQNLARNSIIIKKENLFNCFQIWFRAHCVNNKAKLQPILQAKMHPFVKALKRFIT